MLLGKWLLIVDDEKDVLDTLSDLLKKCKIDTAQNFAVAKDLLENNNYDLAILDIMGVDGFGLLSIANKRNTPCLMLTAHGFSEENLIKSENGGASYYAPKEKLQEINSYVIDVLEGIEKNKDPWDRCFERLGGFFDKKFGGSNWREKERMFWKKKMKSLTGHE